MLISCPPLKDWICCKHNGAYAVIVGRGLDNETPASAKDIINYNMGGNMRYEVQLVVTYTGDTIGDDIIQGLSDAGIKVEYMTVADSNGEFYPEYISVEA